MSAVLAIRALKGWYPSEVLHFLEEADGPINTVEVSVSIKGNAPGQRRKWRLDGRDVRELAPEVIGYIEERAALVGSVDAVVVARADEHIVVVTNSIDTASLW